MSTTDKVSKIAQLLEASGIDPDDIARIEKVRLGTYQTVTKDSDGNVTTHDLEANSLLLTPSRGDSDGPAWPVIQRAIPVGFREGTYVCPECAILLHAIQSELCTVLDSAQGATLVSDTGQIQKNKKEEKQSKERDTKTSITPKLEEESLSADMASRQKAIKNFLKNKVEGVPSVQKLNPVDQELGISTMTTTVAQGKKEVAANVCVVCSAHHVTSPSESTRESKEKILSKSLRGTSNTKKLKTAVILPDAQIGFRNLSSGMDPFHDEKVMDIALQVVKQLQPDVIVNLGDLLDFPMFGKYVLEPSFALTAQAALDRAHLFLAQQKELSPSSEIVLMEGNHDRRIQNSTIINAAASFGLTQANTPKSWPVLSVPHLLRLDELGVQYVDAYPTGRYWINNHLACQHGDTVKSAGMTAKAVLENENVSTIHGHIHRLEAAYNTKNTRTGHITRFAFSAGCLCRIDGSVPSVKGAVDVFGKPAKRYENWQNGLAVVTYEDGDGKFTFEHVHIDNGTALFRGEEIVAKETKHK